MSTQKPPLPPSPPSPDPPREAPVAPTFSPVPPNAPDQFPGQPFRQPFGSEAPQDAQSTAAELAKRQAAISRLTHEAQALRGIPDSSRTPAQKARLEQIAREQAALGA